MKGHSFGFSGLRTVKRCRGWILKVRRIWLVADSLDPAKTTRTISDVTWTPSIALQLDTLELGGTNSGPIPHLERRLDSFP